jgi:NAD(P) transhydrogenase
MSRGMTEKTHFDLIVIGTGPAGEGASMKAAKCRRHVAAVERYSAVGGGATHWGTIPSKALRRAIYNVNLLANSPVYKKLDVVPVYDFPELLATAAHVVETQADLRQSFYDRNHVPLVPGSARFLNPESIEVSFEEGAVRRFTASAFVIATGSRPYRPTDVDFTHPRIFDSDTLLRMNFTPGSVTIYGAGVVGCEYASMLRNMGMDVVLVNTRKKLLEFLDDEIIDALSYHFSDRGITILHGEEYERVEGREDGVVLHLKSGKRIRSEAFLWANGRTGNTDGLGLENLGVAPNQRGQLEVDGSFLVKQNGPERGAERSACEPPKQLNPPATRSPDGAEVLPNIYAVGDVIGWPSLASAAYDQGRFAASHYCGDADYRLVHDVPTGIYTNPEISSVGKTERELTEARVPYAAGKAMFKTLARAQITGQTVGMLKLLFHRDSRELLGIHCFGDSAAEIVHIGQAIMSQPPPNNRIDYFIHTTFNYPTMAEAYRVAALRGLDRLF